VAPNPPTAAVQEFNKYAERGAYHWICMRPSLKISFDPYLHARYSVAARQVPQAAPGATAVDLGCGDGYFSHLLADKGYRVTGVDGMATAIEHARKAVAATATGNHIDFQVGSVYDTQLPAHSADLIACLDVIEHLDDPARLLAEIQRIGKKGARVVIGTPIRFTHRPFDKYHVREFFVDEFRELLAKVLTVEEIRCSHPVEWMTMMGWKFNLLGKQKYLMWNLINAYVALTGRNPLENTESRFPTYQFAVGRL
jgi:2-polyprenyl-3-methyl-5-hydroxy-6-metoxy-1,4-benzoquinol methylase